MIKKTAIFQTWIRKQTFFLKYLKIPISTLVFETRISESGLLQVCLCVAMWPGSADKTICSSILRLESLVFWAGRWPVLHRYTDSQVLVDPGIASRRHLDLHLLLFVHHSGSEIKNRTKALSICTACHDVVRAIYWIGKIYKLCDH